MRLLIFDPQVIGHHLEYLRHLVHYVVQGGYFQLHLVVHPRIEEHAPDLVSIAQRNGDQIVLSPLTLEEYATMERSSLVRRALVSWRVVAQRAKALNVDHCVLMEANIFQLVLGLSRVHKESFKVSGILFFPYSRIEPARDQWWARINARIERFRKCLQLRWVLRNPQVKNIFVLNDSVAAAQLNKWHDTTRFMSVPDPIVDCNYVTMGSEESKRVPAKDDDRMHFLLFGSLREEKGVRQIIEAMARLHDKEAERVALHLLGKPRAGLGNDLPQLIDQLRRAQPSLYIHYENRYLPYRELEGALHSCDVVLVPYQRTEGSSGVIGHAARHRRPVLGPETGLIGELIREYNLGITVDTSRPSALAAGVRRYLNGDVWIESAGMYQYVAERTPDQFARTLLQAIDSKW